jgi:hypothetical protein
VGGYHDVIRTPRSNNVCSAATYYLTKHVVCCLLFAVWYLSLQHFKLCNDVMWYDVVWYVTRF